MHYFSRALAGPELPLLKNREIRCKVKTSHWKSASLLTPAPRCSNAELSCGLTPLVTTNSQSGCGDLVDHVDASVGIGCLY